MEEKLNFIDVLEGFYFFQTNKNPYYITYSNGSECYSVFKEKEKEKLVLVKNSSLEFSSDINQVIKFLSPYAITSEEVVQEIERSNSIDLSSLISLTEDEFLRIFLLIKEKSNLLNVDFIYNTDREGEFKDVIFLDKSIESEGNFNPLFFNNNYYLIDQSTLSCYKSITVNENEILITCNPFVYCFYNQDNYKNSILFNTLENGREIFHILLKEFPHLLEKGLENLSIAFLERIPDLTFTIKVLVELFNLSFGNHLKVKDTKEKFIVGFEFEKKNMNDLHDKFLKFNQLLNSLVHNVKELDIQDENISFKLVRNDFFDVKIVQYVFPKKIELLKIFIEEFIKHYNLNVQVYSDLSFTKEEDNFNMFS
ncbi:MAG: hypothetical protein HS119_11545 [Flavobacteriales bacterium]|nr:hypothetical protein [Flavobacteriales bacterium]